MKTKDLATELGTTPLILEQFIATSTPYDVDYGLISSTIPNQFAPEIRRLFIEACHSEAEEAARIQEQKQAKQMAMAQMLISSGFNFEGYRIVKYSGYISGDDAIQVARGTDSIFGGATDVGAELMKSLTIIRRNALNELKEAAYALGCNAVIGVDFDYLTLDPQTANWNGGTTYQPYIFGVTANGNAVVIEKIEE